MRRPAATSRRPVTRLSRITGLIPASRHADATVLPIYPAPPEIRTFIVRVLTSALERATRLHVPSSSNPLFGWKTRRCHRQRDRCYGRTAPSVPSGQDGPHHADTVVERVQVAHAMNTRVLVAGHLSDPQTCLRNAGV